MRRRGYLTQHGLGLLLGLAITAAALLPRAIPPRAATVARSAPQAICGPFVIEVERMTIERLGDSEFGFVQMHLFRPDGPVPLPERVRISGQPTLRGPWRNIDIHWQMNNEFVFSPPLRHGALGYIPSVDHAGEARGVFTFIAEPGAPVDGEQALTFELPDGARATIEGIVPTRR